MKLYQLKTAGIATALILLAIVGVGSMLVAGAVTEETVTLEDPENETVEVDLEFSGSADATVALEDSDGSTVVDEEVSGSDGDSETASLSAGFASPGDYLLNVTADSESDVSVDETRMIATTDVVEIEDAGNESMTVDVGINSSSNATAEITVEDDSDAEVLRETLDYVAADHSDNETLLSSTYNDSDDLTEGNLTATVEVVDAAAYDGVWASGPSDDLLGGAGGMVPEDLTTTEIALGAIVAVLVVAGLIKSIVL